jgi:8-oxo-dGTP pyrophosphatase MutT (NUDIX family)
MRNPWKINSTKIHYSSPWMTVMEHQVTRPKGDAGIYSLVHFEHRAICVLPLDEHYNTWIVGQFRLPVNEYSWEIPEGGGPFHEEPLESAKRELMEECGIAAAEWLPLGECFLSNAGTDEKAILFVAKNLSFHQSAPEPTEVLEVKKLPFNELLNMVMKGQVMDAPTIIAVLKAKVMIDSGQL